MFAIAWSLTIESIVGSCLNAGLTWISRRRNPLVDGTLRLPGLHDPVDIVRDHLGVPHIYAQNTGDMLFAQGFVHAQDRLWQLDFQRRLVAGRLAEVLGAATLPLDRWMRTIGMRRVADQEVALLAPDVRSDLERYAAGINAGIRRERLPVEFTLLHYTPEPWQLADTLSWIKMMSWTLSVNWETEILRAQLIARLGPDLAARLEPPSLDRWPHILVDQADREGIGRGAQEKAEAARPFTGPPATAGLGSNNWVISGKHTATGKPLLANDMHLVMGVPAIWYENHLSDGECSISGVTFPGIPGVVAGHNSHVAWGFTNGFPDVQDLYMEHLRRTADGRVQYEYRGEWLDAQVIQEQIAVKGARPVVEEVVITRHGPIINGLTSELADGLPLALRWTSLEPDTMIHALRQINCAGDCLELREALRDWTAPVQNVLYADTKGNIGYSFPGKVPIRAGGDGQVPVPGWTGEYEWVGYIPFDELPHLYNPPQGYIVTANNRVAADDYPYYLGREYCQGDRAQRIVEMIEARLPGRIDMDDIRRMQFDQCSPTARAVAACLARLDTADHELAPVVEMMRKWDGRLSVDSPEAAVHEVFVREILTELLAEHLGDLAVRYMGKGPTPVLAEASLFGERALEWLQRTLSDPAAAWPLGADRNLDEIMLQSLRRSVDYLKVKLGPHPRNWAWGRLHKLTYAHILGRAPALARFFNRGPYPVGGDGTTVWATGSSYHDLRSDYVVGPPFRFIADLSDLENSLGLLAPGESGRPGDRHYDDQVQGWFSGQYHALANARQTVEHTAESHLRLEPGEAGW